ncbi:hypothetical protein [Paraburkholderia jirisanensis]
MNFGLLLPHLPHVHESRAHYDSMLALRAREPHRFTACWHTLTALFSSAPNHDRGGA